MKTRAVALMEMRDAFRARIATERDVIAHQGAALRPHAQRIDKVIKGIRYINRHPAVLLLPMTLLAIWRPRRLLGFAISGLGLWRLLPQGRHRLRS